MPEYVHIWLIKLPQKQLFNIKRRKEEEEEEGAGGMAGGSGLSGR